MNLNIAQVGFTLGKQVEVTLPGLKRGIGVNPNV